MSRVEPFLVGDSSRVGHLLHEGLSTTETLSEIPVEKQVEETSVKIFHLAER